MSIIYMCIVYSALVNGAQFLNVTFLLRPLFGCPSAAVFVTAIVPLASIIT